MHDWQDIATLVIITLTLAVFAWRLLRPKKRNQRKSCGHDCGCGIKPTLEDSRAVAKR